MSKKKKPEEMTRAERAKAAVKQIDTSNKKEQRSKILFVSVVALLVAGILGAAIYTAVTSAPNVTGKLVVPESVTKDYGIPVTAADFGEPAAVDPIKVTIYEDLLCPHCKEFEGVFGKYLDDLVKEGKIDVEYRLVGFMDSAVSHSDSYSKRAASASICVLEQDGPDAWARFHTWLYANQPNGTGNSFLSNNDLLERAREFSPDVSRECVVNETYVPYVREATDEYSKRKIDGTPAIFINDESVETSVFQQQLTEMLAEKE